MSKCDNCSLKDEKCWGLHKDINPMCHRCVLLGGECEGETCMVYTGCVYRKVKEEKK